MENVVILQRFGSNPTSSFGVSGRNQSRCDLLIACEERYTGCLCRKTHIRVRLTLSGVLNCQES